VRRDLGGERRLDLAAAPRCEQRVIELGEKRGDAQVRREHGPACRLGRVRGQHELQRDPLLELLRRDSLEPSERVVERLRRDALLQLVRAEPAHAMVLLGDVRELEVEREGAQHARLPVERQRLNSFLELFVW